MSFRILTIGLLMLGAACDASSTPDDTQGDFDQQQDDDAPSDNAPTDTDCPATGLRVALIFDDAATQSAIATRADVVALLERLRAQEDTKVALIGLTSGVRTTSWLDAEHAGTAWREDDLNALIGVPEIDTLFDLQAGLSAAHTLLDASIAADASTCGTTRYVLVTLTRDSPGPRCTRDVPDQNPNFPDGIDLLCDNAAYQACVRAAGVCDSGELCDDALGLGCTSGSACEEPTCAPDPGNGGANVCTSADGETSCFTPTFTANVFGGLRDSELTVDGDYSQDYQLQAKTTAIAQLFAANLHVQLDAVFIGNSDALPPTTLPLLQSLATILGGEAQVFTGQQAIDWQALGFGDAGYEQPTP